ncbi:hypothetical protein P4S85_19040, partial [Aneurinibacillus thermoaerophilus]|nr:hypothetical protein [Aneurinibacillus thermoaerophilus]
KQLSEIEKSLFKKEVGLELRAAGLSEFADFFSHFTTIEEVQSAIKNFNQLLNQKVMANSFVPANHKQTNVYDEAAKKGDVGKMLQAKLSGLFK